MRHGARTPYSEIPNHSAVWNCTLNGFELPDTSMGADILESVPQIYRKNYLPNEELLPGNCNQGSF
jgi:hypothetical protein